MFIDFHLIFIDFQAWLGWLACLAGLTCLADLAGLAWLGWLGWLEHLEQKDSVFILFSCIFRQNTKTHFVFDSHFSETMCFIDRRTPRNRVEPCPHERVLFHIEVRTVYARRMFREKTQKTNNMLLMVTFQKQCFLSIAGRRGTECKSVRMDRVLFHVEVRTLCARRMFRKKLPINR